MPAPRVPGNHFIHWWIALLIETFESWVSHQADVPRATLDRKIPSCDESQDPTTQTAPQTRARRSDPRNIWFELCCLPLQHPSQITTNHSGGHALGVHTTDPSRPCTNGAESEAVRHVTAAQAGHSKLETLDLPGWLTRDVYVKQVQPALVSARSPEYVRHLA